MSILKDLIYFSQCSLIVAKNKEDKGINVKDIKSVKFKIELNIAKEQFDELLRKMTHLESKTVLKENETKKEAKEE